MNKSKLREQIAETISECPYWYKLENKKFVETNDN